MQIGFAGLGRMGRPMALNLATAHDVTGYDPTVSGDEELGAGGVRVTSDPAELVSGPLSISMLPDAATSMTLLGGPRGLFAQAVAGHTHVLMGTLGPGTIEALVEQAQLFGVALVDAPVSGSVSMARSRTLTTMIGATGPEFDLVAPVLAAMTRAQFHVGPAGSGTVAKLAVNLVLGAVNQGVAEALALSTAAGMPPEVFYGVLEESAAAAPYVKYKRESFLDPEGAAVSATISIMHKDLGLAGQLARQHGLNLPGLDASAAVLAQAVQAGEAELDMSAVSRVVARLGDDPSKQ
jgi:3-hydroxyisobutyrate dehydrogenase-like beta-hydroxyacid dehydrogenase